MLREIPTNVDIHRRKKSPIKKGPQFINFVRGGQTAKSKKVTAGILATANDWQMQADVNGRTTFPREIAISNLRPDIVLWSTSTRQVIFLELTVPWELRMEEAHERKFSKYQHLVEECQNNNWRAWNFPIEIGCRGFASQTLWRVLGSLGLIGPSRKKTVDSACRKAEEASCWLWRKRDEQWKS